MNSMVATLIEPNPHIGAMSPYALADLKAPAGKSLISLSQNESLRAPSPAVAEALREALAKTELYPDPDWTELRHAIAQVHEVNAANILCGTGSMELIDCLTRAFASKSNSVVVPEFAYPFFKTATRLVDAELIAASESDATVDVEKIMSCVRANTAIVFVANPGNPTGTRISRGALMHLQAKLPPNVLLVIDEAYGEFADHIEAGCFDMVADGRTIVLRTFSKAYGMAGYRVGWGLFPSSIVNEMRKVMTPNNISTVAQAAAVAAMKDQTYMRETCTLTAEARNDARDTLSAIGLHTYPSATNFLLIEFGTAENAQSCDAYLRSEGVFLRPQAGAGLPSCLRITIGAPDAMQFALKQITRWTQIERKP